MSLPYDPVEAVRHLRKADRKLAKVIDKAGDFRLQLSKVSNVFDTLAYAIISQQLSGKAAKTIFSRFEALVPARRGSKQRPLGVVATSLENLRTVGMSNAKARAIQDLAAKSVAGEIPSLKKLLIMDDEEIIEQLTAVRGIGRWTVEMLLIFHLGRPDILPVDDLGVRKGFMVLNGHNEMPRPKELIAQTEHWRPFRSVASWYCWRACEF